MSSDPTETRASLLIRLKNGEDQQAWQDFVAIYEPLVLRIAIGKGLQPADAHDLAQEVLTRAAARLADWELAADRGSLRGWLSTVTRNLVVDFLRQRSRRPQPISDSMLQIQPGREEQDEEWFSREEQQQIFRWAASRAESQVTASTWQAFWLTAVENRPAAEVARTLGISIGAVYIARSRTMARIRELASSVLEHSTEWRQTAPEDLQ